MGCNFNRNKNFRITVERNRFSRKSHVIAIRQNARSLAGDIRQARNNAEPTTAAQSNSLGFPE